MLWCAKVVYEARDDGRHELHPDDYVHVAGVQTARQVR